MYYTSSDESAESPYSDERDDNMSCKILTSIEQININICNIIKRLGRLEDDIRNISDQMGNEQQYTKKNKKKYNRAAARNLNYKNI